MVNDARKEYKTISKDSANKRRDNNSRRGIDTGWIEAILVLDKTNILDSPLYGCTIKIKKIKSWNCKCHFF